MLAGHTHQTSHKLRWISILLNNWCLLIRWKLICAPICSTLLCSIKLEASGTAAIIRVGCLYAMVSSLRSICI
uniref:Uncharacterized protein n=1 Tax=Oryza brachyantha TaxID=4533 RepID=J3N8J9_ORYBR